MRLFLLDALEAAMMGQALGALILYFFLALVVIGLLVAFWKGYKQHQIRQVARQGQWTVEETLARLERKKGRRRVWVAVIIVCVILASYPW
jgi:predicted histidine transporter YuiF (NhaC family)